MMAEPFRALHVTEDIEHCRAFGLGRTHVTIKDDPTHVLVPYT
jgi:hypothetical protein